jgi:hypothetical protein
MKNLSDKLDQIANLLEMSMAPEGSPVEKTASAGPVPVQTKEASEAMTAMRLGLLTQARKADYLDLFESMMQNGAL